MLLLTSRTHPGADRLLQPFLQGMRDSGYLEGGNLVFHWAEGEGRPERLPALAAELVAQKVELIVAGGHEAAWAAKRASNAIPIVFMYARDPVGQGLVTSLAKPGGNITGFAAPPLGGKWVELLLEVTPRARRLAVIYTQDDEWMMVEALKAVSVLKLTLLAHEIRTEAGLEAVLQAIEKEHVDGLMVLGGVIAYVQRERILKFAAARRLPAIYGLARWPEDGGLMSYGVNYSDNWRRTVSYADRILKGAKPADLPVQLATKLELVVNAKAARELGITIPASVLLRADRVIEQ